MPLSPMLNQFLKHERESENEQHACADSHLCARVLRVLRVCVRACVRACVCVRVVGEAAAWSSSATMRSSRRWAPRRAPPCR